MWPPIVGLTFRTVAWLGRDYIRLHVLRNHFTATFAPRNNSCTCLPFCGFPCKSLPYFCLHNVTFCVKNLFLALPQTRNVELENLYMLILMMNLLMKNSDAQW